MPPKEEFVKSMYCTSRMHCTTCRDIGNGKEWREKLRSRFILPFDQVDFACPHGKPWTHAKKQESPPPPTVKKAKVFLKAIMTAGKVSSEIASERTAICATCEFRRTDKKGDWCKACGCRYSADVREIKNLSAYNEGPLDENGLPEWGCKHPSRKLGKGWKR